MMVRRKRDETEGKRLYETEILSAEKRGGSRKGEGERTQFFLITEKHE